MRPALIVDRLKAGLKFLGYEQGEVDCELPQGEALALVVTHFTHAA